MPPPSRTTGLVLAMAMAASRSGASITQNPAMTSLESMNGPSVIASARMEVAMSRGVSA